MSDVLMTDRSPVAQEKAPCGCTITSRDGVPFMSDNACPEHRREAWLNVLRLCGMPEDTPQP